jgi:hypothetical protein
MDRRAGLPSRECRQSAGIRKKAPSIRVSGNA